MKSNRLSTLILIAILLKISDEVAFSAQNSAPEADPSNSSNGLIRLEIGSETELKTTKIACVGKSKDSVEEVDFQDCFSRSIKETVVCKSTSASQAYTKKLNSNLTNPLDLDLTTVSFPQSGDSKCLVKRYNYLRDIKTGLFAYIEEFCISKDSLLDRKIYLNKNFDVNNSYEANLAYALGAQWEGGANSQQAFEQILNKTANMRLPSTNKSNGTLTDCDFFASALDSEGHPLAIGLDAGDFGESTFMGGSSEGNPMGSENAISAGLSFSEKSDFYGACMSSRFVRDGEMQQVRCNLGLPNEIVSMVDQANALTQPGLLHLLTGEALQGFLMGHAALNGQTFSPDELKRLMQDNPACIPFKSIFRAVAEDQSTLKMLKNEADQRYSKGSFYLKLLRKEALVREGSLKNVDLNLLSLAELLKSRAECQHAYALSQGRNKASAARVGVYSDHTETDKEVELFKNNQCDKLAEMDTQIRSREGMFPLLANDYDAEANDKYWASPYDMAKGREFLKELAAIDENDDDKLLHFAKLRLGKSKLKAQELIADTCSATDMNCTDKTKMCWHTLIEMDGLVKEVAKSTQPSLDPMFECLDTVKSHEEGLTNAASMGAGLACGALGVAAGIASGGVAIPATLTAASVVCGLGVMEFLDRPMQTMALTDFELARACFELSPYCNQKQVEQSEKDLWWAIFGTKLSLGGEALGVAGELAGIARFMKNMPLENRELFIAYLKGSGIGKSELAAAESAKRLLEGLVGNTGDTGVLNIFLANQLVAGKIDVPKFLALDEPQRLIYLRGILPEMSNDALETISKQLAQIRDLEGVQRLVQLSKKPNTTPDDLVQFIKDAPSDEAYTERVASLSLLAMDDSNVVAQKAAKNALDSLIHNPEEFARLERGSTGLGCQ